MKDGIASLSVKPEVDTVSLEPRTGACDMPPAGCPRPREVKNARLNVTTVWHSG